MKHLNVFSMFSCSITAKFLNNYDVILYNNISAVQQFTSGSQVIIWLLFLSAVQQLVQQLHGTVLGTPVAASH